jgi:hypothetical protein
LRISVRKIWLSFAEAYPYADDLAKFLINLRSHPPWAAPA